MPSQHLLCCVMLKLLSFYSLGIRLQRHCMACSAPLAQLISQTYFMPFALTANAIVARVFAVASDMLPSIERAWSLMTVALARAPLHASPSPESAAVLANALPALSAPLSSVHDAAVQQLQNMSPRGSTTVVSEFPIASSFLADSPVNDAKLSAEPSASFKNNDEGSEVCAFAQDDMGVPIGSSKKSSLSKLLRRQKRPLESDSMGSSPSLKKSQGAVGAEIYRSNPVAVRKLAAEQALLKEPGQVPSGADDIFSALCGFKK